MATAKSEISNINKKLLHVGSWFGGLNLYFLVKESDKHIRQHVRPLLGGYIEKNVYTWVTNCFSPHKRVIFVFISRVAKQRGEFRNEGNKHKNNPWVSAETARHESTYIILFVTWHNESINDNKNDDLYISSPCVTCSVFVLLVTPNNQLLMTSQ